VWSKRTTTKIKLISNNNQNNKNDKGENKEHNNLFTQFGPTKDGKEDGPHHV
jgi:hypothetical protein